MGIVYEAFDRERSTRVALKTLQHFDPAALYRFKQEFRSLADVTHPNLIALYELLSEGDDWFFTMEFVEGVTFLEYLHHESIKVAPDQQASDSDTSAETETVTQVVPAPRAQPDPAPILRETPADLGRLRAALPQLVAALNVVHSVGKLHRDIKPSNVMVTPEGRVVVLDFGLTFDMRQSAGAAPDGPAGTLVYMSPEQARGAPLSPATDWFSAGVMLYKALTGRLPISGPHDRVLASKQTWRPKPPSAMVDGVPPDLDHLCMDLLELEPEDRPTGLEIAKRLSPAEPLAFLPAADSVREGVFVGRAGELAALHEAFGHLCSGSAALVLVHGPSGVGKTALVHRFLDDIGSRPDTLVLSGRCYEQESVPYKAFDSLIDELGRYLRTLDSVELAQVSPRNPQAVAQIFPVLSDLETFNLPAPQRAAAQDLNELRRQAFVACRELLTRMGDRKRLVLSIDDLQWSDPDSAALLAEILRPPDAPAALLIGTYRGAPAEPRASASGLPRGASSAPGAAPAPASGGLPGAMLEATALVPYRREMAVNPLTTGEAVELAERLLEHGSDTAKERAAAIARESGGHAYFIHELAHAGGDLPGESQLDSVIWHRVSALPDPARRLLETISIYGRPITQEDAYGAAGFEGLTPAVLAPLKIGALVRGTGPNRLDLIEAYHDRIRESVVAHLPPETQVHIHGSLARVLEASGRAEADSLALHFDKAGSHNEARRYYVLAAEHASQTVAFDRAVTLYRRALELTDNSDAGRPALKGRLADALANAGRGQEAASFYQELAAAADPHAALDLRRQAAYQLCISGHLDEGRAVFRQVLDQLGLWSPQGPLAAIGAFLANRALLRLRGLRFTERDPASLPKDVLARVDAARAAATSLSMADLVKGAYFNTKSLQLALRAGDPARIVACLTWEAAIQVLGGLRPERRARRLLARSRAIVERHPEATLRAVLALSQGTVEFLLGNFPESVRLLTDAENLLVEHGTGMVWELSTVRAFIVFDLQVMGSYRDLWRRVPALVQNAHERGDLYTASTMSSTGLAAAYLAADDPLAARRTIENTLANWTRAGYHEQHLLAFLGSGWADLYEGKPADAWQRVHREWPLMEKDFLLRADNNRVHVTDVRARSAIWCASQTPDSQTYLRSAGRDAAYFEKQHLRHGHAFGFVTRAGIAALRGDRGGALTLLERALALYDRVEMKCHAAAARRRLGLLIGGQRGAEYVGAAEEWMRRQGIQNPARMTDMLIPVYPAKE